MLMVIVKLFFKIIFIYMDFLIEYSYNYIISFIFIMVIKFINFVSNFNFINLEFEVN